ncbi:sigma-70 family RNA polymerase sigma factor [Nonomuraea sp. NPDC050691]|uniref:sigma-70 family RNA polymerase sigma factor n=1 Tax=Nonomuraea sp. NPDC050691 TaxID=3155661 RepID=UPI0033CBBD7B
MAILAGLAPKALTGGQVAVWRARREHLTDEVPSPVHEDEHELGEVWQRLRALSARQRAVLVLRYYEGLADEEIAARLGISQATVRGQASRGLATLRVRADALTGRWR